MKTYNFSGVKVRVIDCTVEDLVDFRVAEVYDAAGNFAYGIRTQAKGKQAAKIAYADALRFRYI